MSDPAFEVISTSEYQKRTRGRGRGRTSKYSPLGREAEKLGSGKVIALNGSKNQVVSIRNFFKRNYEDEFVVRSVASEGDTYDIYISRNDG